MDMSTDLMDKSESQFKVHFGNILGISKFSSGKRIKALIKKLTSSNVMPLWVAWHHHI
jgi:hypothetical protein